MEEEARSLSFSPGTTLGSYLIVEQIGRGGSLDVAAVLAKALAKVPTERYESASDFVIALSGADAPDRAEAV